MSCTKLFDNVVPRVYDNNGVYLKSFSVNLRCVLGLPKCISEVKYSRPLGGVQELPENSTVVCLTTIEIVYS